MLALDAEEKDDPDLIRAMARLSGGLDGNELCGCLSGGACFLSYFAGKGSPEEEAHPDCSAMIQELTDWFWEDTSPFGGVSCRCILDGDSRNKIQRCPVILEAVAERCIEILEAHGCL